MPAIPFIPAIIGGVASIGSALIGKSGAAKAGQIQSEAGLKAANLVADATQTGKNDLTSNTNNANGVLSDVYGDLNSRLDPYAAAGNQGVTSLAAALAPGGSLTKQFSFNPSDLTRDPGYQFQLKEGMKAITNSAAARGALGSGSTGKSMVSFGEGLAGTTYNQAYSRALNTFQTNRNNTLGGLSMLTNIGMNTNQQAIGVGENYGNQTSTNDRMLGQSLADLGFKGANSVADILTGRANAQAASKIGQADALSNGVQGVGTAITKGVTGSKWYKDRTGNGNGYLPPVQDPSTMYDDGYVPPPIDPTTL